MDSCSSDSLPESQYEEDRVQRLNQLENRIAKAQMKLKSTGETLRKKKKRLESLKEDIVDAKKVFWRIDTYVSLLERQLDPLLMKEQLRLPTIPGAQL